MGTHATKAVVVGGGAAGLAAAIGLARAGREVTVLEASDALGGRARSGGPPGFAMNLGPHALYPSARRRLAALGVEVTGGVPSDGMVVELGGRLHPFPTGVVSLLGSAGLSWTAKWQIGRTLGALGRVRPETLDGTSLRDWLEREPRLGAEARSFVEAVARLATYVNAPRRLCAGAAVRQLKEVLGAGVLYVDGGWGTIVDGLAREARRLGVRIETGARATAVLDREVRLRDGRTVPFEALVLTVGPRAATSLLGDAASAALRRFAEAAAPVRAACLDVALAEAALRDPALMLGVDRPLYVSDHGRTAKLAPDGGTVLHAARYLEPGARVDAKALRRELEEALERLRPGWRDRLAGAVHGPACTVMHAFPEASRGGLAGRPTVGAAGPPRLALAGDWVGPRGMLLSASLESAADAVAYLEERSRSAA